MVSGSGVAAGTTSQDAPVRAAPSRTTDAVAAVRHARAGADERGRDFLWIVGAALLFYGLNVDFRLSGDSAMYADYVLLGKFNELTLHIGYYAVVYALQHTVGALLGLPIEQTMVWLNVVAGALALGVMYLLARHLLGSRRDALLCVALLAVCGRLISNATTSEIYMLQTCLVMGSFLLFVQRRVFLAGMVAGGALLVSPLSAFAYLFFPAYELQRAGSAHWRTLLRLAGGALLVYLPYFAVFAGELFWGHRGLLNVNHLPLRPWVMLEMVPRYQFKHYTALCLLLLPALLALRREKRFLALTLAVVIPHLYIASKLTAEDNVFLLSTDFFFAGWLVIGWRELARTVAGRGVAWALLATHVALLLISRQVFAFEPHREYAAQMRGIAREYLLGRDAAMIADWERGIVLTFYGRPAVVSTVERDPLYRQMHDVAWREIDPRVLNAKELYLLDAWYPGPLNRLLSSGASLAEKARNHSVMGLAEPLHLDCAPLRTTPHRLYRCVRRSDAAPAQVRS